MVRTCGKVLPLVVTILLATILGGCGASSAERLPWLRSMLGVMQDRAGQAETVITNLESAAREAQVILNDPNLSPELREKAQAQVARIEEQLARYRPVAQSLQGAILQLQERIDQELAKAQEIGLGTELQVYGEGISGGAATLPPPWNAYGAIAGLLLTTVGGAVGALTQHKKDSGQMQNKQQQAEETFRGLVQSVDALLRSPAVTSQEAAKTVLKDYQVENCPETRVAVRKAKGIAA